MFVLQKLCKVIGWIVVSTIEEVQTISALIKQVIKF